MRSRWPGRAPRKPSGPPHGRASSWGRGGAKPAPPARRKWERGAMVDLRSGDYWQRMAQKRTRVALTWGGLEPVEDNTGGGHRPSPRRSSRRSGPTPPSSTGPSCSARCAARRSSTPTRRPSTRTCAGPATKGATSCSCAGARAYFRFPAFPPRSFASPAFDIFNARDAEVRRGFFPDSKYPEPDERVLRRFPVFPPRSFASSAFDYFLNAGVAEVR